MRALRLFLSRLAGLSLFWFARVGTRDATNSFKAYSVEFVRDVGIDSNTGFEIGIGGRRGGDNAWARYTPMIGFNFNF